jgi:hypothetical protein
MRIIKERLRMDRLGWKRVEATAGCAGFAAACGSGHTFTCARRAGSRTAQPAAPALSVFVLSRK